jgi:hypothetical protein
MCCRWADKVHGSTLPVDGPYWAYTLHEPIGVVGQVRQGLRKGSGIKVSRMVVYT